MTQTPTPNASALLTGAPMDRKDRAALRAFRAAGGAGRGARLSFAHDHDRYPELAEVARQGRIVLMAYREAATGAAVVVCGDGHEIGRGASMGEALELAGAAGA